MNKLAVGIVAVALLADPASAATNLTRQSSGYTYFNRVGADISALRRDAVNCAAKVSGVGAGAYSGLGGVVGAILSGSMQGQIDMTNIENCMVVSGWRVFRIPEDHGRKLRGGSQESLTNTLAGWVGSDVPPGDLIRTWQNDATNPDTVIRAFPGLRSSIPLGLLAALEGGGATLETSRVQGAKRPAKSTLYEMPGKSNLSADLGNKALLVVTVRNSAPKEWTRVQLVRLGEAAGLPAWQDGQPDFIRIVVPQTMKGQPKGASVYKTLSFVVPAGRWAIYGISDVLSLCLGAPFIDLEPGSVTYTGGLDFGAAGLPISTDMTPVEDALAGYPDHSKKAKIAKWQNGATFPCEAGYFYAMEITAAPEH